MVDFSKYQVKDDQVIGPEIIPEKIPGPIKEIKPIKKAKKTIKPKIESDDIKITSDKFRTAISLITDSSTRKSIEDCKIQLEHFLLDYKILKIGKDFYFRKKNI